jgi:hypothetical protein
MVGNNKFDLSARWESNFQKRGSVLSGFFVAPSGFDIKLCG